MPDPTDAEPSRPEPPPATRASVAPWLFGAVAVGIFLRVWRAGSNVLFMDEIHAIADAVKRGYREILTEFQIADSCIPLTLYNKLMLERGGGLDEWVIRAPCVAFGVILLLVVARAAARTLRPTEAILVTGALALSPYVIYLSREARPYPIMMALFALAAVSVLRWTRGGRRGWLLLGAGLSALTLWFHPITLPAVGLLGLYPLTLLIGRREDFRRKDYILAVVVFAGVGALCLGPPLPALLEQRGIKGNRGMMMMDTVRDGLMLLHCLPVRLPLWSWAVLAALGIGLAGRRFPREVTLFLVMTAAQAALIVKVKPWLAEVSWVSFRYFAHLLPFFLVLALFPVAALLERIPGVRNRHPRRAAAAAAALVLAWGAYHVAADHYVLRENQGFNMHPYLMYLTDEAAEGPLKPQGATDAFYRRLGEGGDLPDGGLLEVPMSFVYPLVGFYQRIHGRPVVTGALLPGWWQPVFRGQEGFRFRTAYDVFDAERARDEGVRFLVIHRQITYEMGLSVLEMEKVPVLGLHVVAPKTMWEMWKIEFGAEPPKHELPAALAKRWPLIHEDEWIRVYDLEGTP